MTTEKQLITNRDNAQKSTGPKTFEGKAASSQNAVKHGLFSREILLDEEKRGELQVLRDQLYSTFLPEGALEDVLVEKIINAVWRLKRLVRFEVFIFETEDLCGDNGRRQQCLMFLGSSGEAFSVLSRYETMLEKSFYKAVHELERLQARRFGQAVLAPIVIDISNDAGS